MQHLDAVNAAANQAVFHFQYPTRQAVKYICQQVPGCTVEQAGEAIRTATTFHQ